MLYGAEVGCSPNSECNLACLSGTSRAIKERRKLLFQGTSYKIRNYALQSCCTMVFEVLYVLLLARNTSGIKQFFEPELKDLVVDLQVLCCGQHGNCYLASSPHQAPQSLQNSHLCVVVVRDVVVKSFYYFYGYRNYVSMIKCLLHP